MTPARSRHTAPPQRIRIVLTGDVRLSREGLRQLLAGQGDLEVVGEASGGEETMEIVARLQPDVVVLDIGSRADGLETTRRIAADFPRTRILVLTVRDDGEILVRARQAGASGVLMKGSGGADLLSTIRAIHRGEQVLDPSTGWKVLDHLAHLVRDGPPAGGTDQLTTREREVLQLLAEGRSNREITERLFITMNTLKTHIRHLQRKLGTQNRLQTVAYALRQGFVE